MEKRKINTTARGVDTQANIEDSKIEGSLRPKSLDNYIGQKKHNLYKVTIVLIKEPKINKILTNQKKNKI